MHPAPCVDRERQGEHLKARLHGPRVVRCDGEDLETLVPELSLNAHHPEPIRLLGLLADEEVQEHRLAFEGLEPGLLPNPTKPGTSVDQACAIPLTLGRH